MKTPRNLGPHAISAGGGIIMLVELYRHWRYENEMELGVMLLGGFFLWYGGYLANSKRAIEGGNFVIDGLVKLGSIVPNPFGRRAGDGVVVQRADAPPVVASLVSTPAEEPPQITWKDGRDEGDM